MNTEDYAPEAMRDKWQPFWDEHRTFRQPNPGEPGFDPSKPKFYVLDMFPYPSGAGLHVGHPEGYTATDIVARYKRMRGFNVLHPMGWDAFGLPAEQHAVETGRHPAITTKGNIDTFRRQLKMLGFSYDWDRELATTDVDYYRWTQWIFLQLFNSWYDELSQKARPISELPIPDEVSARGERAVREYVDSHRLAYLAEVPVNWCPALGTVLANEEVTNEGRSDRGNHPVFRRPLRQWMLRITKYADRLTNDLDDLDWPESIKLMQQNWVGRSEGAQVRFKVDGTDDVIEVYTTRPDTLFGATYMVLAPEHPLVEELTTPDRRDAVQAYCKAAAGRSELARTADTKEKTGEATGAFAINPVWPEGDPRARIPIWVADYVMMTYGTGAIMAVPAHDTRDFEFAKEFDLPMIAVVMPPDAWLHEQINTRGVDRGYAERKGNAGAADKLLESATAAAGTLGGITAQDAGALLDGDAGWMQQVGGPAYANDPGLFMDAYTGEGEAINSGEFDGLGTTEFKKKITASLKQRGLGCAAVNYKLRDWLFSRQRYWGEPFPILHGQDGELVALNESELPLELPEVDDYRPVSVPDDSDAMPSPPLGQAKAWMVLERDGKTYRRELNTMPQWAGSCWYYLRFCDPKNSEQFCSPEAEQYWMGGKRRKAETPKSQKEDAPEDVGGIDLYLGGAEHAVLHLLYARFWHKVLFDLGYVSTPEPFKKLFNQGMIRAFAYKDHRGAYVSYDDIEFREDGAYHKADGSKLAGAIEKMSKSLKNVINPDAVVEEYGADALRLYEMFMGPLDASKPWNPRDVQGVFRFLQRTWRLIGGGANGGCSPMVSDGQVNGDLERFLHKTIKKVGNDIERLAFNTAISTMMEFVNEAYRVKGLHRSQADRFVRLLSPFAPHLCEELWQRLCGAEWKDSVALESWPAFDAIQVVDEEVEIPVQIMGKLAGRITVAKEASQDEVRAAAMTNPKVAEKIGDAKIAKEIYVPGRMMNFVLKR
ncbi:MAG: class I tRNA ligase family protein [Planctomycetota bacterium]